LTKTHIMKHLGISGGGTKIAGLFGAAEVLIQEKGYQPDIISGISAGAILAVPLAMGKFDEIRDIVLNLKQDDFFSKSPIKKNGKLKFGVLFRALLGKPYLGKQDNLKKTIKKVISREDFSDYQHNTNGTYPICIVGAVDFYSGKRFYFDLKKVTYDHFIDFVNASGSLPVFTEGVTFNEGTLLDFEGETSNHDRYLLFDGGVRDHSPTAKILTSKTYRDRITESFSIFSRPRDIREIIDPADFEPKNVLDILERHIEITNAEISKNDETGEEAFFEDRGLPIRSTSKANVIYLPRIMKGVYDVDKGRLREIYEAGKEAARNIDFPGEEDSVIA